MKDMTPSSLPPTLLWLKDAPLFIDKEQVDRFYDAVVRPKQIHDETRLTLTEENAQDLRGKLGLEGKVELSDMAGLLSGLFGLKPSIKASGEGEVATKRSKGQNVELTLREISTPQRQLELLIGHYLVNYPKRVFLAGADEWRNAAIISGVPRAIVFLDLPGRLESTTHAFPRTKLIPMAAEFANGVTDLMFRSITAPSGERAPKYPDEASPSYDLDLRAYWKWFDTHFSAKALMQVVEESASKNGRIRWIDYRVPLTIAGDTLHLHLSPGAEYDTGVFAYNFINRGHSHGLRVIGTLKSGPDMNVLAVYEK